MTEVSPKTYDYSGLLSNSASPQPSAAELKGLNALFESLGKLLAKEHTKPKSTTSVAISAVVGGIAGMAVGVIGEALKGVLGGSAAKAVADTATVAIDSGAAGLAGGVVAEAAKNAFESLGSKDEKEATARKRTVQALKVRSRLNRIKDAELESRSAKALVRKAEFRKVRAQKRAADVARQLGPKGALAINANTLSQSKKAKRKAARIAWRKRWVRNSRIGLAGAVHVTGSLVESKGHAATGGVFGAMVANAAPGIVAAAGGAGWLTTAIVGGVSVASGVGLLVGAAGAAVAIHLAVQKVTDGQGLLSPLFDYAVTALLAKDGAEGKKEHSLAFKRMRKRYALAGRRIRQLFTGKQQDALRREQKREAVRDEACITEEQAPGGEIGAEPPKKTSRGPGGTRRAAAFTEMQPRAVAGAEPVTAKTRRLPERRPGVVIAAGAMA